MMHVWFITIAFCSAADAACPVQICMLTVVKPVKQLCTGIAHGAMSPEYSC